MSELDPSRLRLIFDGAAELYDRARPNYPTAVFDALAAAVRMRTGTRVLEIGCGTGQATSPLAARGCEIIALDIGPEMARVARRNLQAVPAVQVITANFEDWPLPATPFEVVVSATAFHWVDPEMRVGKAADALRVGGALATIATHHIAGGTAAFFVAAQACYERWDPATPPGLTLQASAEIALDSDELDRSGRFTPARFYRFEWDETYTTASYIDLLLTYSGHRALPVDARQRLLGCLTRLIDEDFGGTITKRYMAELRIAFRIA